MGRRKIEIKQIRDDRNRSVTFLKRKGGLFKKAHELSVLCAVEVAVIIIGNNKKLYEYSSHDINNTIAQHQYYGGSYERKGPADFADKGGGDDDDEDDGDDDVKEEQGTPVPVMQPQMQHHPGFQHVRHGTPSGSPPMHNGALPQFQRGPSPLPPGVSRPSSRTSQHPTGHIRRPSSNLAPIQQPPQPPTIGNPSPPLPQPANFAYQPNSPFFNAQAAAAAHMQRPPQQQHPLPHQATYPPPGFAQHPHPQMQQAMMEEVRRASVPPNFAQQQGPPPPPQANMLRPPQQGSQLQPPMQRHPSPHPPGPPQQQHNSGRPSPQPPQQHQFASPQIPQPRPLPAAAKASVIFTPIDDSRSMLAQHWGSSTDNIPRSSDGGASEGSGGNNNRNQHPAPKLPSRNAKSTEASGSLSRTATPPDPIPISGGATPNFRGHGRTSNSAQGSGGAADAKRPRLKVQIPSEHSGDEGGGTASADASTAQTASHLGTATNSNFVPPPQQRQHHILPPPSPSAGNPLLSAGAQGPPNPFARPAPPMSTNPHAMNRDAPPSSNPATSAATSNASTTASSNSLSLNVSTNNMNNHSNHIETPLSALPSRFMSDNLLPSPSSFYPEWNFGRMGSAAGDVSAGGLGILPSPLNFGSGTPVGGGAANGTSGGASKDEEPATGDAAAAAAAGGVVSKKRTAAMAAGGVSASPSEGSSALGEGDAGPDGGGSMDAKRVKSE